MQQINRRCFRIFRVHSHSMHHSPAWSLAAPNSLWWTQSKKWRSNRPGGQWQGQDGARPSHSPRACCVEWNTRGRKSTEGRGGGMNGGSHWWWWVYSSRSHTTVQLYITHVSRSQGNSGLKVDIHVHCNSMHSECQAVVTSVRFRVDNCGIHFKQVFSEEYLQTSVAYIDNDACAADIEWSHDSWHAKALKERPDRAVSHETVLSHK